MFPRDVLVGEDPVVVGREGVVGAAGHDSKYAKAGALPYQGFYGVKLEDQVLVTYTGCEPLSSPGVTTGSENQHLVGSSRLTG